MTYHAKPSERGLYNVGAARECPGRSYGVGERSVDPGFGFVDIARNDGSVPAEFYATYILPAGSGDTGVKIPTPGQGNPACPF